MDPISCPQCNKMIIETAEKCANCGYIFSQKKIEEIKKPGMTKKEILIVILVAIVFLSIYHYFKLPLQSSSSTNQQSKSKQWYEGGNLHRVKIPQWQAASYENRLATAADFIAAKGGFKEGISHNQFEAELRVRAVILERCITDSTKGTNIGDEVAAIAAVCFYLGHAY